MFCLICENNSFFHCFILVLLYLAHPLQPPGPHHSLLLLIFAALFSRPHRAFLLHLGVLLLMPLLDLLFISVIVMMPGGVLLLLFLILLLLLLLLVLLPLVTVTPLALALRRRRLVVLLLLLLVLLVGKVHRRFLAQRIQLVLLRVTALVPTVRTRTIPETVPVIVGVSVASRGATFSTLVEERYPEFLRDLI